MPCNAIDTPFPVSLEDLEQGARIAMPYIYLAVVTPGQDERFFDATETTADDILLLSLPSVALHHSESVEIIQLQFLKSRVSLWFSEEGQGRTAGRYK
jgi:hypothetical protein